MLAGTKYDGVPLQTITFADVIALMIEIEALAGHLGQHRARRNRVADANARCEHFGERADVDHVRGGMAIELAAARVRVMPPRTLLLRMSERFKLLSTTAGRQARHHVPLENVIDRRWWQRVKKARGHQQFPR